MAGTGLSPIRPLLQKRFLLRFQASERFSQIVHRPFPTIDAGGTGGDLQPLASAQVNRLLGEEDSLGHKPSNQLCDGNQMPKTLWLSQPQPPLPRH